MHDRRREELRLKDRLCTVEIGTMIHRQGAVKGDRDAVTHAVSKRPRQMTVERVEFREVMGTWPTETVVVALWHGQGGYPHWCRVDAVHPVEPIAWPEGDAAP